MLGDDAERPMTSPIPAYILQGWPGSLTITRALGRCGVPVTVAHHDAQEPALRSRYCRAHVLPPLEHAEQAWLDWVLAEGRARAPVRSVLFPSAEALPCETIR